MLKGDDALNQFNSLPCVKKRSKKIAPPTPLPMRIGPAPDYNMVHPATWSVHQATRE